MTTVEYVLEGADDYKIIKRITLPDAEAVRYYREELAALGIDSWIS